MRNTDETVRDDEYIEPSHRSIQAGEDPHPNALVMRRSCAYPASDDPLRDLDPGSKVVIVSGGFGQADQFCAQPPRLITFHLRAEDCLAGPIPPPIELL